MAIDSLTPLAAFPFAMHFYRFITVEVALFVTGTILSNLLYAF